MAVYLIIGLVGITTMAIYIGYLKFRVSGYLFNSRNMSEALNHVDAAIYMRDRSGRYIYANHALVELRKRLTSSNGADARTGERVFAAAEPLTEGDIKVLEQGVRTSEEVMVGSGEMQTAFLETKYPLIDKRGRILGLVGILTDVTELYRLRRELEQAARSDELTGLFNRRAFFDFADSFLANARRHGRPLSILIIDIDHFKRINDLFGHPVGDRVLKDVSSRMLSVLREVDRLARIGGEEFAVLLPETTIEQASQIAVRMREALHPIDLQRGTTIRPTVSIGVATLRPEDHSIHGLYQRADAALYRAKAGGRDKVVCE